jgi:hypothetical protein
MAPAGFGAPALVPYSVNGFAGSITRKPVFGPTFGMPLVVTCVQWAPASTVLKRPLPVVA